MGKNKIARSLTHSLSASSHWMLLILSLFVITACSGTQEQMDQTTTAKPADSSTASSTESMAKPEDSSTVKPAAKADNNNTGSSNAAAEKTIAAPGAVLLTPVEILSYDNRGVPKRAKDQDKAVIKFCVAQPYAKYKKQVVNGIKQSWEKTQAGVYGVGFRNKKEYNRWNSTQKDFFLYMFDACRNLAMCEIESKKTKKKNACGVEQVKFNAWQDSAKNFADQVTSFKDTQPPSLCSLTPNEKDASLCFGRLADQIDQVCNGDVCQELSQCWRSIAIKDDVIRQAESSCGFSGQKLSKCSGYIGAVKTRKDRFNACKSMQDNIKLSIQP